VAEIRRIMVGGQPQWGIHNIPSQPRRKLVAWWFPPIIPVIVERIKTGGL
jgi:hypothetical protein